MSCTRYSVNTSTSSQLLRRDVRSTEQMASNDQFKKLSVTEELDDTLDDKEIRKLIYDTDSEDVASDNEDYQVEIKDNTIIAKESTTIVNDREEDSESGMSTSEKLKRIAEENEMLAKELMVQKNAQKKKSDPSGLKVTSSAAINRKKAQWSIDRTNQILYKKIQAAKPSGFSIRKGLTLGRQTKLSA